MERDRPCLSTRRSWFRSQVHIPRMPDHLVTKNLDQDSSIKQIYGTQAEQGRRVKEWEGVDDLRRRKRRAKDVSVPAKQGNWSLKLDSSRQLCSAQWSVNMFFIMCLSLPLSTTVASVALECPQDCACPNSSTASTTSPTNTAYSLQDPGAFTAINCSSLHLTEYTLHFTMAKEYNVSRNFTAADDNDEGEEEEEEEVMTLVSQKLQLLDLSNNALTSAKPMIDADENSPNVTFTVQVEVLDFSYNFISEITSDDLSTYAGVRSLDLSHNRLSWVDADAFNGLVTVTDLNLSHNAIQEFANDTVRSLVNLRVLDLSSNTIEVFMLDQLHALSSLKYLYLNDNNLHPVIRFAPNVFPPLPTLVLLDLSNNPLEEIPSGMFHSLPSLVILNMANCSLQTLSEHSLEGLRSLQKLSLDQNDISAISWPIFENTSLTSLSLSSMPSLSNISHDAFLGLSQLVYLNLSHNQELNFLQPNLLTPLTSLQVLDISKSSLTQLSEITFHKNKDLAEVYLLHNPFTCSCINAWLAKEVSKNQTSFVDVSSLQCLSDTGVLSDLSNASSQCEEISIHNMTSEVYATLGSQLLLKCQYEMNEPSVIMWTSPRGKTFYHHHFHPDASQHLRDPEEIQPDALFHKGHYWHDTSSYHSELSSFEDRVIILSDGSLYIDYMLRTDTGPYQCQVSNAQYNQSVTITLFVDCKISTDIKICCIIVGLLCALTFFTLNLTYVIITWIARRLVNKRRREIIRQMLENLNTYKSAQISRIHENYTHQLGRVRNQYHIQRDRLHRNYTSQVTKMKRGCSNQVERVRDNYNSRLTQLREYSSNQVMQIRERANNQIVRIRDYGSTQLDKLRETYKLQQQHVLKLLDTMNLDNCRNVVETECMRTESMMYDIDLLGDDDRTDSPISQEDSEYNTAASSPASSLDDAGLAQDMREYRGHSDDSSDHNDIIIEMQTTIDMEGGLAVDVAEQWRYRDDDDHAHDGDDEDDTHNYSMNIRSNDGNKESLFQLQSDRSLFSDTYPKYKKGAPLPTYKLKTRSEDDAEATAGCAYGHQTSDSDSNWDGNYMTPEASPTKVWPGTRGLSHFQEMEENHQKSKLAGDMDYTQDSESLSSETIV